MAKREFDWITIRQEWEAGQLSVAEISRLYGPSRPAIDKRAAKEGWKRDLAKAVRKEVQNRLVAAEVATCNSRQPEDATMAVDRAAARGVEVIRSHQKHLAGLKHAGDLLLDKLTAALEGRAAEDQLIPILTAQGDQVGSYLSFMGPKESFADVLAKLSQAASKWILLERRTFSLDEETQEKEDDFATQLVNARKRAQDRRKVKEG